MNRQLFLSVSIGFVIGMSLMSIIKNNQMRSDAKLSTEAVQVTVKVAQEQMERCQKIQKKNDELAQLVQSYESHPGPKNKTQMVEAIIARIKDSQSPLIQ